MNKLELAKKVVENEINDQREHWPLLEPIIEVKEAGDFVFAVFHAKVEKSSLQRYGIYCISGWSILYEDSNAIDPDKFRTIEDAIRQSKNYFNHYANELNQL